MWHMQFDNIFTINLHFFVFEVFLGFEPFDAFVVLSQWSWDLELTSWFLSDWKTTFQIRSNIKLEEFKDSDRKRFWYCYSKTLFQGSCIFWSHPNPRSKPIFTLLPCGTPLLRYSASIDQAARQSTHLSRFSHSPAVVTHTTIIYHACNAKSSCTQYHIIPYTLYNSVYNTI